MTTDKTVEAVEQLSKLATALEAKMTSEVFEVEQTAELARDLRALLSELTRLQEENGQLRLAICGGEDAPGYADSLPLADILGVAANNLGSWREASDRAARLQEEVKGLREPAKAIFANASVRERLVRGQKFNVYNAAEEDQYLICLGPITDALELARTPSGGIADALTGTLAALATLQGQQS